MTAKKTASQQAAEMLGYAEPDPHADMLGDVEALLSRGEWSEDDRAAARAALDRAKTLPPREPEEEKPDPRPATASELAAARLAGQSRSAKVRSRGWNR